MASQQFAFVIRGENQEEAGAGEGGKERKREKEREGKRGEGMV